MVFNDLNMLLISDFNAKEQGIRNEFIKVNGLTLLKLRDILFELGYIYKEDLENNTYIAIIGGGTFKKNKSIAIFNLTEEGLKIAIYAKEGLIKQNTAEGVINEFRKRIEKYI